MANYTNYWYIISLRIRHPTRSLDDLGVELNLTPSRVSQAGAPRTSLRGAPLSGVYAENFWTASILEGALTDRDLAAAITVVLDQLSPKMDFLLGLVASGGRSELFIGWFFDDGNSGDVLDHKLLGRLAEFKIDLSFDVYP
jgi:hypothetical protein